MENKTIPTAEEFAKKHHPMKTYPADWKMMIEFAKMHVEVALKMASLNAKLNFHDGFHKENKRIKYFQSGADNIQVDKDSILNGYSLDNIK